MENTGLEKAGKIKMILGAALSCIVLALYIGCSMINGTNSIRDLQTIFTEESLYAFDMVSSDDYDLSLLARTDAAYMPEEENTILYDIDLKISASVENESQEINKPRDEDVLAANDPENSTSESLPENEEGVSSNAQPSTAGDTIQSSGSSSVESDIIILINNIRADRGLQSLNPNSILNNIARSRSQDMVDRGYFSHSTPEGKNISDILAENGVMYAYMAENLSQSSPPSWGSPAAVLNLWMNSSLHRGNLLNPHYGQLGLGVADGNGRRVVTLILINR